LRQYSIGYIRQWDVITTQRYGYDVNILIDVSANGDVITMQRYGYGVNILMDVSANGDVITM